MGKDGHVIPDIINRIKKLNNGEELKCYGANQTRSFIYIKDAIRDTRIVASRENSNDIINIGVQQETEIWDLIYKLIELSGKSLMLNDLGCPKGSINRRLPNMDKFKAKYGEFKYTRLEDGLKKTYNWYMNND
jgi:UDP-glucose 4-epimerase/UDP-glucuronate decarboxylase